jgi:ABC-type Fe3+/spermidine/putrescine transport system ATPase subunit
MLRIEGASKSFDRILFKDLDLSLSAGERISLTGPSGCGKTTLLRCIAGLESLDEGRLILDDNDVTNVPPEKRGIGLLFQNPVLYHHLDVAGNLRLGKREADVSSALKEVGLEGFEDRRCERLSGGEAQRVALARALLAEPKILLLDEPFSAVDDELRDRLLKDTITILDLRGTPAILVTHNQKEAKSFSENIIIMREQGPKD